MRKKLQNHSWVCLGLHFMDLAYTPMYNVMSIFLFSLAWLACTHVSHDLGWHAHAYSVCNNFSLNKIE